MDKTCWIDKLPVEMATVVLELLAPASPVALRLADIMNGDGTSATGVTANPGATFPDDLLRLHQVSRQYETIAEDVLKMTVVWWLAVS